MTDRSLRSVLFVAALILSSHVEADDKRYWCGTSQETIESTRAIASWAAARDREAGKRSERTAIRKNGDLFIIDTDEFLAPFNNPADLVGRTITFIPQSSTTFRVEHSSLVYDEEVGPSRSFPQTGTNDYVVHSLASFSFPFQGRTVRNLYISERFGVFLAAPAANAGRTQFGPLDIVSPREAVIAPYLQSRVPRTLNRHQHELFVKESGATVTITWRSTRDPELPFSALNDGALDIQMVLGADGSIRFSYRTLTNIAWGSAVITSGSEAGRDVLQQIATVNDPVDDVNLNLPLANLLDIRQVQLHRVGDSELIRVRIQLGGRISPNAINRQVVVRLLFTLGTEMTLVSQPSGWRYCVPGWGCTSSGGNVQFLDDGVDMYVLDRYLPASANAIVETYSTSRVDVVTQSVSFPRGNPVDVDLTAVPQGTVVSSPVFEAFTVPVLNPQGVWERIRSEFNLWDEEVDGVAIFQNFTTDLRTFATAYSTVGNSGADGVWLRGNFYGSNVPRSPALLHMNQIIPERNDTEALRYYDFLLGHELGHRWLYGFTIDQEGQPSFVLGPFGHPAQYVDTSAAFPVYTNRDYSVMGGSNFEDLGAGQFRSPDQIGTYGYSWHELYLMGLASPAEVDPWFYLAETDPELGEAYHPPSGIVVSAQKVGVDVSQIMKSMGARSPVHEDSQREFRVLFVLLNESGEDTAEDESTLAAYASQFPGFFSNATGGRGTITMTLPLAPAAQFAAPTRGVRGEPIAFRDTSPEYPAAWTWNFGDGTSSNEQFPRHAYREPGTYTVTLRVRNSRGENSTSQSITIEPAPRSRPVRR